jgi:sugar lactone lactonase YvrE
VWKWWHLRTQLESNRGRYVSDSSDGAIRIGQLSRRSAVGNRRNNLGVTVSPQGKIFILTLGKVLAFHPDGSPTTPTIDSVNNPWAVAVDGSGKIYVVDNAYGMLDTFDQDGTPTTPTITGLINPQDVAVGADGKIYIAGWTGVSIYNADGTSTGLGFDLPSGAVGIAVH